MATKPQNILPPLIPTHPNPPSTKIMGGGTSLKGLEK